MPDGRQMLQAYRARSQERVVLAEQREPVFGRAPLQASFIKPDDHICRGEGCGLVEPHDPAPTLEIVSPPPWYIFVTVEGILDR